MHVWPGHARPGHFAGTQLVEPPPLLPPAAMSSPEPPLELDGDFVELLDELLGDGGGGESSWDGGAAVALAPLLADGPHAPHLAPGWRCIHPSHVAPCRCTAAPSEAEDSSFELVGENPGQNGTKALRALVVATPEWRDARTRLRLAAEWAQAGGVRATLAPALRSCAASALRRAHLLAFCRAFRFASCLWRRKPLSQRATGRARTPSGGLQLAPLVVSPVPPASPSAFAAWLQALQPTYAAGLAPFRDSSLLMAAVASRNAMHLRSAHAAQFALFSRLCFHGATALRAQAAAAERWHAACAHHLDALPAWSALPPGGLQIEGFIRYSDRVVLESVAPPPPGASAEAHAALAELRAAALLNGDIDTRVLGALEQLKAAPLPDFLQALAAAAAFWADWTQEWGTEIGRRAEWASSLVDDTQCSTVAAEPAALGLLLRATEAQGEAIVGMIQDVERQCAALQLTSE